MEEQQLLLGYTREQPVYKALLTTQVSLHHHGVGRTYMDQIRGNESNSVPY
jgi:hypothetical protein